MVKLVIFDLDGTLLDTESLVVEIVKQVLANHGHVLTEEARTAALGKKPVDSWQATIDALSIGNLTAQQAFDESEPLLNARWPKAKLLPGASRLAHHLQAHNVPMAIATSSLRYAFERKMGGSNCCSLRPLFQAQAHLAMSTASGVQAVTCGDEVKDGKPAPECFLQTAAKMQVDPKDCLVIEDAPAGVEAASRAGMRVVVVPSLADSSAYPQPSLSSSSGCVEMLSSLLDFKPERFGLPGFEDVVHTVVPLQPAWRLRGQVVKGFGRGSKELGIPTANLDALALQGELADAVTGIYAGFASIGSSTTVHKMCMSIGWNPFYKNAQKTVEPWILHKFEADFYGEELRLVVCGYIRPESSFDSLEALISRIHEDGRVSELALAETAFSGLASDAFLQPGT